MPKYNDYDLPVLPDSKYAVAFICKATPPAEDLFHLYFVDKVGYVEDNSEIIDVDGTLWYKGNLYTLGQTADYEDPNNIDPDKLLYGEHYVCAKTTEAMEAFGSEYPGLNTESWVEVEWDDFTEGGAPEGAAFAVAAEYNGPHWSNVTLLDQYGNVFIEGSKPIDVVAAARRRYSSTLGYLMGVCAPPLKLPDKQPTAYSYNGVVLPKLPESEHPYATIVRYTYDELKEDGTHYETYIVRFSAKEFYVSKTSIWHEGPYEAYTLRDENGVATLGPDGKWKLEKKWDHADILYAPFENNIVLWSNHDVYYAENYGGGLYFAKSEPSPVYE